MCFQEFHKSSYLKFFILHIHINWSNKHCTKDYRYLWWYNVFRKRNFKVFHNLIQFDIVHALKYQAPSSTSFLSNLRFNLKLTCKHLSEKDCKLRNYKYWMRMGAGNDIQLWKYLRYLHLVLSPLVNQAQFTPLGNQCTGLPIQVDHCPAARSRWQTWIYINIIKIGLTRCQIYLPNA